MRYTSLTAKDCQHIRSFLGDVGYMLLDSDLLFSDDDVNYDGVFSDPTYKLYREIREHISEAHKKLSELEVMIRERKELAS